MFGVLIWILEMSLIFLVLTEGDANLCFYSYEVAWWIMPFDILPLNLKKNASVEIEKSHVSKAYKIQ